MDVATDPLPVLGFVTPPPPTTTSTMPPLVPVTGPPTTGAPQPLPSVVGQPDAQASATLQGLGYRVRVVQHPDPSAPVGIVLAQSPAAGTPLGSGSYVSIVVSAGPVTPTSGSPVSPP